MSGDMNREVAAVKTEMVDLRAINRRIVATLVRLEGKVDDMGEGMATRDHFNILIKRMDGFTMLLEDSRCRRAVHADTLASHAKRLKKLERSA